METVSHKVVDFRKTRFHDSKRGRVNKLINGCLRRGTMWRDLSCFNDEPTINFLNLLHYSLVYCIQNYIIPGVGERLATAFDLAAIWLSMIAPVKKSVNHPRTVATMRETATKLKLSANSPAANSTGWSCLPIRFKGEIVTLWLRISKKNVVFAVNKFFQTI